MSHSALGPVVAGPVTAAGYRLVHVHQNVSGMMFDREAKWTPYIRGHWVKRSDQEYLGTMA